MLEGNHLDLDVGVLMIEFAEPVNQGVDASIMILTIPLGTFTVLINLYVFLILRREESTPVNQMMKIQCLNNMSGICLGIITQSPYFTSLGIDIYCSLHASLTLFVITINRLVPVAIAGYR